MRRGQYATTEYKSAPLYKEFARPFLERRFSPAVVAALYEKIGTYSRGPRKGLTRGYIHWLKVHEGGWYRGNGGEYGRVIRPGTHNVCVRLGRDSMSQCVLDENANATDEMRIGGMVEALLNKKEMKAGAAGIVSGVEAS